MWICPTFDHTVRIRQYLACLFSHQNLVKAKPAFGMLKSQMLPLNFYHSMNTAVLKVVRYVTFSNCQNWRSIKIFIYSYNTIRQPPGSRIKKRQCDDVISASKNDVFDRFSGIKVSKNFRFFSKNTPVVGKIILFLMFAISFMTLL